MSDAAAHPPPPAETCRIRGCNEAACAPEYKPELGLWTTRCKKTGVNTDGSSRPSWHHALWNTQCKTWMWTCRGLTSRSSRSQAIVSIEVTEPTIPIQDCMPSGQVLSDGRDDTQTQPGAPAMLHHDIPEHKQEDVILDKMLVIDTLGRPTVGPGESAVGDFNGSCISALALCDDSQGGAPGAHRGPQEPSAAKPQATCHKQWKGPTEEDRAEMAEEDVKSSDDTWLPGTAGRKGHARRDCRLCHHPRGDMLEQRGQLCTICKGVMRQDGRRKTKFLQFTPYRRAVRVESLRRRNQKHRRQ
jgi:hypothetical protein